MGAMGEIAIQLSLSNSFPSSFDACSCFFNIFTEYVATHCEGRLMRQLLLPPLPNVPKELTTKLRATFSITAVRLTRIIRSQQ